MTNWSGPGISYTQVRRVFEDRFDKKKYMNVLHRFQIMYLEPWKEHGANLYAIMIAIMTAKSTDMNIVGNKYNVHGTLIYTHNALDVPIQLYRRSRSKIVAKYIMNLGQASMNIY